MKNKKLGKHKMRDEKSTTVSPDRRKIVFSAIAGLFFIVFLLSGIAERSWPISGIVFDNVYASEGEDATREVNDDSEADDGFADESDTNDAEVNDESEADDGFADESDADYTDDGDDSEESGDVSREVDTTKEDLEESVDTENIWCIGCSDSLTSTTGGDEKVAELPLGGVPLPAEEQHCIGCSDTTDEFTSTTGGDEKVAELPLGGVPLPAEGHLGVTGFDSTDVADTINGDDNAIYDQTIQDQPLVTKESPEFQMEGKHPGNGGLKVADDSIVSDTSENGALIGQDVLNDT